MTDYNIYNIVKMRIIKKNRHPLERFVSHLDMEYEPFKSKVTKPNLIIIIGRFEPNLKNCKIIDNKYYVDKNYIYFREAYKIANWETEIKFVKDSISVKINSNLFGYIFFPGYIIEPLIKYIMTNKGKTLIHAGGVEKNGAIIFPSRGGAGKTTISLYLVDKGYSFFGDDHILLRNNIVFPYPKFLHVFNYHLSKTPIYEENLSFIEKVKIKLKFFIYHATFKYAKFFSYLKFEDIFPKAKISKSSKLKSVYFVIRTNNNFLKLKKVSKDYMIKQLVLNEKIEMNVFSNLISAYSLVFPKSKLSRIWKKLDSNIRKSLKKVSCYVFFVPGNFDNKKLQKISEMIK